MCGFVRVDASVCVGACVYVFGCVCGASVYVCV